MPTYDYECQHCKAEFQVEQRISELPIGTCPICQGDNPKRLISAKTNFVLTGSGWAKDNYSKSQ